MYDESEAAVDDAIQEYNKKVCWTTADGRCIPIQDLTDEHLNNIINMIEREAREGVIHGSLGLLGDDGPWAEKIYGEEVLSHYPYYELKEEQKRRNELKRIMSSKTIIEINHEECLLRLVVRTADRNITLRLESNYADLVYADIKDFINNLMDEEVME